MSAPRKHQLTAYVHVFHNGERHVFGPDDTVPENLRHLITNPKAWVGGDEVVEALPVPPLHGKGSSRDAWVEYAQAQGVEVPADAGRDDIVSLLMAAGVRTAPESQ